MKAEVEALVVNVGNDDCNSMDVFLFLGIQ